MPSPPADLLLHLEQRRRDLRAAIDAAPAALRGRSPGQDRWSVDQIVEHLSIVEAGIVRLLGSRLRALGRAPLGPPGTAAPRLDAARVLDRTARVVAIDAVRPRGGVAAETAWAALERSRAELLEVVRAADGRDVGSITAPHPWFGPLGFWQWVEFTGLHESRHAAQIREVTAALTP